MLISSPQVKAIMILIHISNNPQLLIKLGGSKGEDAFLVFWACSEKVVQVHAYITTYWSMVYWSKL